MKVSANELREGDVVKFPRSTATVTKKQYLPDEFMVRITFTDGKSSKYRQTAEVELLQRKQA